MYLFGCGFAHCAHVFRSKRSFKDVISIGNRMNASAFRDLWARVMF